MPLDDVKQSDRPSPIALPNDERGLVKAANELIQMCRASSGIRAAYCRQLNAMVETGRADGTRSLINLLYQHHDRLAAHMFSAANLKFTVDFENDHPSNILQRGVRAARVLDRDWKRNNTDIIFGQGVFESLKYGAAILKQTVQEEGEDRTPVYYKKLVMPWQFGVIREDENDLSKQSAFCETVVMTLPEVWRRIWHFPDAHKLFDRIKTHANKGQDGDSYNSFFHQVFSTSQIQTGVDGNTRPIPGGIVQLNNDPNYAVMGPQIEAPMVRMHELWVWGATDYETIQIIEPDILVTRYKRGNLLISGQNTGLHPYTRICANDTHGYFWGRPESVDLFEPQGLLSQWAQDIRRLFGLQIDKIIGFSGFDGLNDENYDQMRGAGYYNMPPGATATDLTPQMPPNSIQMLEFVIKIMNMIGGFDNILGGGGEPGVRAGVHADTLLKTASPRLRDRALGVERQCAAAGELRLSIMRAKDSRYYWTDGTSDETREKTKFLLSDVPDDFQVQVDSHSSSPIFMDDHANLIWAGVKAGIIPKKLAVQILPFPQKDLILHELTTQEQNQAAFLQKLQQEDPEAFVKLISGKKK